MDDDADVMKQRAPAADRPHGEPRGGSRRAVGAGHGRYVMPLAGALRLRDGRRPPARRRPGQAEQTVARGASRRLIVEDQLTWRPGRRPAPPAVRVDGKRDGDEL